MKLGEKSDCSGNDMNEEEGKFVVKDKRRFSEDGEEKVDNLGKKSSSYEGGIENKRETSSAQPDSSPNFSGPTDASDRAGNIEGDRLANMSADNVAFARFVISIAQQAFWQMGLGSSPTELDIKVDLDAAKEFIDILSLIEKKTQGNLDSYEKQMLTEVLHELRMAFVKVKGK